MIDRDVFKRMNDITALAGHDPARVADYLHVRIHPAYLSINGMVTRTGGRFHIALNENQPAYQYTFACWHEIAHIVEGHLDLPGFMNGGGVHIDTDSFSSAFAERMVSQTELAANLAAADQMLDTSDILMRTGYYALAEYRSSRQEYWSLRRRLQRVRDSLVYSDSAALKCQVAEITGELRQSFEKIMDLEHSFSCSDFMSIPEIALANQVPEHYVRYKLEALRIQGFDIDVQELLSYEKVFTKERTASDDYLSGQ